ncbi:MAG: hypothetical protein ABJP70_08820 [Erythrobacter sp.]
MTNRIANPGQNPISPIVAAIAFIAIFAVAAIIVPFRAVGTGSFGLMIVCLVRACTLIVVGECRAGRCGDGRSCEG